MEQTPKKNPSDLDNPKYDYIPTDADIQNSKREKKHKKK